MGGNQFALYLDRPPLGPNKQLRLRICGENEKKPISPGELRRPCHDDRESIFFTDGRLYNLECVNTNLFAPKRTRNRHALTVVLMNEDKRRIGEAAYTVNFEVNEQDARRCRGL